MTSPSYPIGVIDDPLENGARFSVMPQNGRQMPAPGHPVTVWNQTRPGGPMARFRGEITELSPTQGTFIVQEQMVDPDWPKAIHPLGRGNPVYLAHPGSFNPDMSRQASREEFALMNELSNDHQNATGIEPCMAVSLPIVVPNPDEEEHL